MNKRIGDLGQIQAASFPVKQGYRILHQNLRLGYKVADILVVKDQILVAVEDKLVFIVFLRCR
jgi:Holliday junction resolvase-like predicted endonuclease